MATLDIPRKTVYRLSIYLRCLQRLVENEVETVSSHALARAAGVKPTQLRKDLAYFGQFGTRGLGYQVGALEKSIRGVLGQTRLHPVVLVGVGNLGSALLRYGGFQKEGFEVIAAFDIAEEKLGMGQVVPVYAQRELGEFVLAHGVKMAILTVPVVAAQEVTNVLVGAGVQAILNFCPTVLEVPAEVMVNSVDLAMELENMSYFVR